MPLPGRRPCVEPRHPFEPATAIPTPPDDRFTAPVVKRRATFHLPLNLINEARDTVVALGWTLSKFVEEALLAHLSSTRRDWNDGRRLPTRRTEVKRGRPRQKGRPIVGRAQPSREK